MELCQRGWNSLFLCIRADIFQHMRDLGEHQSGLTHIAFEITFSQILFQRSVDLILVFPDGSAETFQGADAKIKVKSCAGVEVLALFI